MNCWQSIVFPEPGSPMIRLMPFTGRPPPRIRSSPSSPLVTRSSTSALPSAASDQRARAEQVLDGRDELERVERLLQEGVGARRQRLVSGLEDGDGEHGSRIVLLQAPAQVGAPASGDHQLHDRELGPALEPPLLGFVGRQGQLHLIALGAQEELLPAQPPRDRVRRAARAAACRRLAPSCIRGWPASRVLGEQPVRVGRRETTRDLRRDEPELLHLVAGVEAVSPALRSGTIVA